MAKPPWTETPHQTPGADSLPDDQVVIGEEFNIIVSDWLGSQPLRVKGAPGVSLVRQNKRARVEEMKNREREKEGKKETL